MSRGIWLDGNFLHNLRRGIAWPKPSNFCPTPRPRQAAQGTCTAAQREERNWLVTRIASERRATEAVRTFTLWQALPEDEQHESTDDFPGLVRAADLIGQLADINYLRKQAALFNEFRETGMSNKLKYNSVADLRANYPDFFWKTVRPYIGDALRYLRVTQEGQQWIANLYANVFPIEHRGQLF